jgi:LPXTG-site transpeptidase (sortase) family protein
MNDEGSMADANHRARAPRWSRDQALTELEKKLWAERSHQAADRLREAAAAEQALEEEPSSTIEPGVLPPGRPSDAWSGEWGEDSRYSATNLWPTAEPAEPEPQATHRERREWRSLALLALEIVALIGFVLILVVSYVQLQDLNRELRQAQAREAAGGGLQAGALPAEPSTAEGSVAVIQPSPSATATPTTVATSSPTSSPAATLTEVPSPTVESVLAGGSPTPTVAMATATAATPTATATPSASLTATPLPTPTATPTVVRRAGSWVVIPALDLEAPIVAGDDPISLTKGVGHRLTSAAPGESSNCVLSAHNDVYGAWFRDLHKLKAGDEVEIQTVDATFVYVVRSVEIVLPTAVEVLAPTEIPILTLISCYPMPLNTHRVVVVADLASAP